MTDTLRSILITHPKLPNVTFRVGVHALDAVGPNAVDEPERRAVVEFSFRNGVGVTEVSGSLFLDQFEDIASEIVKIGKRVVPKSDG